MGVLPFAMENWNPEALINHTRRNIVGWNQAAIDLAPIEKGGSDRKYFRLTRDAATRGPQTIILMAYTDRRPDNLSFFAATEVLVAQGVRTPKIYAHDPVERLAWLEDLGTCDLWGLRHAGPAERLPLYRDALEQAARVHALRFENIPARLAAQLQPPFDEKLYLWEQDYFFNNFVRNFSALSESEAASLRGQPHFQELAAALAQMPRFMVHRDFQSQNILVRDGRTWFIDYQGLRPGRPEYDLASLLYDPYVPFSAEEREDLAAHYFETRQPDDKWDTNQEIYAACICQRLMQALGAYGFLGIEKQKESFLQHIPRAVENLRSVLTETDILPGLLDALRLREDAPLGEITAPVA
jgi:aminoglycoside/choline kinase family phosphotransferase